MDKKALVQEIEKLINTQTGWGETVQLTYTEQKGDEYVDISSNGSFKARVCITADSGMAIIRDVVNNRYFN